MLYSMFYLKYPHTCGYMCVYMHAYMRVCVCIHKYTCIHFFFLICMQWRDLRCLLSRSLIRNGGSMTALLMLVGQGKDLASVESSESVFYGPWNGRRDFSICLCPDYVQRWKALQGQQSDVGETLPLSRAAQKGTSQTLAVQRHLWGGRDNAPPPNGYRGGITHVGVWLCCYISLSQIHRNTSESNFYCYFRKLLFFFS